MEIPKPLEQNTSSGIPATASELTQTEDDPEAHPFLMSFERYNSKECQLQEMEGGKAKKALLIVRDVGMIIKTFADFKIRLPKLEICSIQNSGDYRSLYKGLSDLPDIEINEIKIDKDKGRLFFFLINRICHIVAIRDSHYDTDKQRR